MSDPEIEAMGRVATALDSLSEDARGRVLRWAADRYGAAITPVTLVRDPPVSVRDAPVSANGVNLVSDDRSPRAPEVRDVPEPTFEHFVDLFDAVDPKSDVDKAL